MVFSVGRYLTSACPVHTKNTRAFEGDFSVHEGCVDTLLEVPDKPTERLLRRSEGNLDLLE
jgi:hypothetical protein